MSQLPTVATEKVSHTLPSGRTVIVHPFVGRDERALLYAKVRDDEDGILHAVIDMLSRCADVNAAELKTADVESLFIKVREISVGEEFEVTFVCTNEQCGHPTPAKVRASAIVAPKCAEVDADIEVGRTPEGAPVMVRIGHPTMGNVIEAGLHGDDSDLYLIYRCVKRVWAGNDEFDEFAFEEFAPWFMALRGAYGKALQHVRDAPVHSFTRKYSCPKCKQEQHVHLSGLKDLFG